MTMAQAGVDRGIGALPGVKILVGETRGFVLALDMSQVMEIARIRAIRKVPLTRPYFLGYGRWRESLLPVLDLGIKWLEDPSRSAPAGQSCGVVVLAAGGNRFGISLDRTIGIGTSEGPALRASAGPWDGSLYVIGRIRILGGREAFLIDAVSCWEEEIG